MGIRADWAGYGARGGGRGGGEREVVGKEEGWVRVRARGRKVLWREQERKWRG